MAGILQKRRVTFALVATFTILVLLLGFYHTNNFPISNERLQIAWKHQDHTAEQNIESSKQHPTGHLTEQSTKHSTAQQKEKLAYATFFASTVDHSDDLEDDKYFQATRILVWHLLHKKETRTKGIDVVVLVTPTVSESRRERLRKDGAIVRAVEPPATPEDSWLKPSEFDGGGRWDEIMAKLCVMQMTEYSRVLLLDGDILLRHNLDGVWDDPAAQIQRTRTEGDFEKPAVDAPLPETYLMAGQSEVSCWETHHDFPPKPEQINSPDRFNGGFMMFAPNKVLFEHYMALLNTPDSFDSTYMEQSLLNQAHKETGAMPFTRLDYKWVVLCPNENDFKQGIVTVHEKWWGRPEQGGKIEDQSVNDWLLSQRWEMKGWYDAWDRRSIATRLGE